jgi:hypothetical protein
MFSRTQAEVRYQKTPSSSLCSKETCNNEMTGSTLVDLNQQAPQIYGRGFSVHYTAKAFITRHNFFVFGHHQDVPQLGSVVREKK